MLRIRKIFFISIIMMTFFVVSSTGKTLGSTKFISKLLNIDKFASDNDHGSRIRRSARTTTPVQTRRAAVKFVVGECDIETFLHATKNCSRAFYTAVRRRDSTRQQCGTKFITLQRCMMDTLSNCIHGSIVRGYLSAIDEQEIKSNFLVFLGNEAFWCEKGGLGIASEYLPVGSVCHSVFLHVSEECTATYGRLFNSSTVSDERLCNEYRKAKKCFLHALFQHCSFSRMLLHILEILVEITADFQPFCKVSAQEIVKFEDLFQERTCPPYSLSDVAFMLDVTNSTTKGQFMAMRRVIGGLTKQMNYGLNGIQIAVYHFDVQIRAAIKFGTPSKNSIQKRLKKMRRTTTTSRNKGKRMTGRSLSSLARNTFSPHKEGESILKGRTKSGHRPYNAAIAFVLTTGASNDSMIAALQQLKDRHVHVVFIGPSTLKVPMSINKFSNGFTHRVIQSDFKFDQVKKLIPEVAKEICTAEKTRQKQDAARLREGPQDTSKWGHIQTHFSRLGLFDLSLLFELRPMYQPTPNAIVNPPSGFNEVEGPPIGITEGGGDLPSEYVDGMDGDYRVIPVENNKPPSPNENIGQWPYFYLEENAIIEEYMY